MLFPFIKNLIQQALLSVSISFGFAQPITLDHRCDLPDILEENSGMIALGDSLFVFINDSGNEPCIYVTDSLCEIRRKVCFAQLKNVDWEELTVDKKGNMYIGDFGNNRNNRQKVFIYKLALEPILKGQLTKVDSLEITYVSDTMPPSASRKMYDMEAMVWHNDSLFLFSKNRREPFDGISWVFALPDKKGKYELAPIDSIQGGKGLRFSNWITAADYHPSSNLLLLLASDKCYGIRSDSSEAIWKGELQVHPFGFLSQKESIAFGENYVYVSDERNPQVGGGALYRFPLYDLFDLHEIDAEKLLPNLRLPKRYFTDKIELYAEIYQKSTIYWELFDVSGEKVAGDRLSDLAQGHHRLILPVASLSPDIYVLNVVINGRPNAFRVGGGKEK